jgi:hypothetical protein
MGGGGGGGHLKGIIEYMFYCVKGEKGRCFQVITTETRSARRKNIACNKNTR